jgi:hypothetical protein
MTATYCDITGNEIESATTNYAWRIRDSRYDVIRGRDFSVDGMKKLESAVFEEMAQSDRFNFMEYKQALATKIQEMTD